MQHFKPFTMEVLPTTKSYTHGICVFLSFIFLVQILKFLHPNLPPVVKKTSVVNAIEWQMFGLPKVQCNPLTHTQTRCSLYLPINTNHTNR